MAQMRDRIRQRTLSADGSGRNNQRYLGVDGFLSRGFDARAENGRFFPVDGGQGTIATSSTPQSFSQPIVLQISNSTASTANINLFGAAVYLDNSVYTWTAGNLVVSGITISVISLTQALQTYRTVLYSTISKPMTIGKTTVQTISGPDAQTTQIWSLSTFGMNANAAAQQYTNFQDPTQFRDNVINNFSKFDLDDQTYITIPVLGSAVFYMAFYPLADVNLSRGVIGQPVTKTFGPPPGNLAPQPVVIQN